MINPEQILERAIISAESAEVFYIEQKDTPVRFEANQLQSIDTRELTGVALRLIKDGRIGFCATTNLNDLDSLIDTALETAPYGAEARFEFPPMDSSPDVPVYDASSFDLPLERMVRLGQQTVEGIRSFSDEILVGGTVSRCLIP